jgi:hypothetical protein
LTVHDGYNGLRMGAGPLEVPDIQKG